MKSLAAQLAYLTFAFALAKGALITENALESLKYPTLQEDQCGGVLKNDSGRIIYKPYDLVDSNERCVWVIAALDDPIRYRIRIYHAGFDLKDGLLNLAELNLTPESLVNGPMLNEDAWEIHTSVGLMITFATPKNVLGMRGFVIDYEVMIYGYGLSPFSDHHIIGPGPVHIKFPADRTEYDHVELATYVFPPYGLNQFGVSSNVFNYRNLGLDYCSDYVSVMYFDRLTKTYRFGGSLCDDVTEDVMAFNDLAVVIFRSDSVNKGKGFTLTSANCGSS